MIEPSSAQFLSNRFGDEYLYEVNRGGFDRLGAHTVFEGEFGSKLRETDHLYLIIGTDSGLLPAWLLAGGIPEGSRYLFIELPQVLEALGERLDRLREHPRLAICTPDAWQELDEDFQFGDYACLEAIAVSASIAAQDAYLPDYRPLLQDVQQYVETFTWKVAYQLGNQVFVRTHIENLAENRVPAVVFKDSFAGRTAVVLGGGPSLDDLLPWVIDNRERLIVIAVSRICRRLLEAELQPDIVVSIDPHPVSFDVSKELLRLDDKVLLMTAYHVSPLLLAQWHGPTTYFGPRYPWKTKANPDNLPNQGPTVTNTALAMAVELGCRTVILGGVDLCYSKEGHTHALGSNERQAGPLLGAEDVQVETNGGWLADTNHAFAQAVENIAGQAAAALERGCTLINSAAAACRIPNVDYCPIEQLPLPEPGTAVSDTVAALLPADARRDRLRHYQEVKQELARINGRLRSMAQLALDALDCNDGLFGRNGKTADFKYKKRMDKIERKLDHDYKDLAPLIKNFGARTFLRLVRPHKDKEWSEEEIERWGRAYYESYKLSADLLLDIVEQAQQRLDARLEELAATPDVERLSAQWLQDNTPGRAKILLAEHPLDGFSGAARVRLDRLLEDFEDTLSNRDTQQARWCAEKYTLAPVRSRLALLFQRQDQAALSQIAAELAQQSGQEAEELALLARGYLHELAGEPEQALGQLQRIVDSAADALRPEAQYANPRLEDALRHMCSITLQQGDPQSTLMVLDALTMLAPNYAPQYAELLRLTGQLQAAADVYTNYLQRTPGDMATLLRLGKLYQEAGAMESARWAYRHILEQDPENRSARQLLDEMETATSLS